MAAPSLHSLYRACSLAQAQCFMQPFSVCDIRNVAQRVVIRLNMPRWVGDWLTFYQQPNG